MWPHNNLKTILILMPLAFAFAVALDLYIPAVPQLVDYFHSTPAQIQITLSGFMLAFGIGQLVVGPYSDKFGRRIVALISAMVYLLSSLLCAASDSIWTLVLFRMIQAIGSCGMLVAANAIVRDIYSGDDSARMYSYLNGAISMSPLFAPFIGGYVDVLFGWRACFITLALFGIVALAIVVFQLKETHPVDKRLNVGFDIFKRYRLILSNTEFLRYTYCSVSGVICLFCFFSVSPYILITDLGISRQHFGWYFGVMGLLFFIGSLIAGKAVTKIGVKRNLIIGMGFALLGGILMLVWNTFTELSTATFIIPMVPISLGAAFLIGAGAAGAMEPFPQMAGAAAALFGCAEFLIAAIVGNILLQFSTASPVPLAWVVSIASFIALLILMSFIRRKR